MLISSNLKIYWPVKQTASSLHCYKHRLYQKIVVFWLVTPSSIVEVRLSAKKITLKGQFRSTSLYGITFEKSPECWTQIPQSSFCLPKYFSPLPIKPTKSYVEISKHQRCKEEATASLCVCNCLLNTWDLSLTWGNVTLCVPPTDQISAHHQHFR